MNRLPCELISYIGEYCGLRDLVCWSLASSYHRNVLSREIAKAFPCPAKYTLFPEQKEGYYYFASHPEPAHVFFQSPMGSGKTALALMVALLSLPKRTILVVPVKTITSWLDEIQKFHFNLDKKHPENSEVLVLHTNFPAHQKWCREEESLSSSCKLILTTTYYILRCPEILLHWKDEVSLTVLDEAHLIKPFYRERFFQHFPKVLYLSASPMPETYYTQKVELGKKKESLSSVFPSEIRSERDSSGASQASRVPRMKTTFLPEGGLLDLLNSETFGGHQVVLFTKWKCGPFMTEKIRELKEACSRFTFLRFNNKSTLRLKQFRNKKDVVLVCNYKTAKEGTNFECADTALYLEFWSLACKSAHQCLGRVRRRNNPHRVIRNYFFLPRESSLEYVQAKLNVFTLHLPTHPYEKKTQQSILAILDLMKEREVKVENLSVAEMVTIFGSNPERKPWPFQEKEYPLPLFQVLQYATM